MSSMLDAAVSDNPNADILRDSTLYRNIAVHYRVTANWIAVDALGNFAALSSKRGLYIIDLEEPWDILKTLHQQGVTKYDVSVLEWNPHEDKASFIASASNRNISIWNLDDSRFELQTTIRAHERVVSDLSWSPFEPHLLATSSADKAIHIWDLNRPKEAHIAQKLNSQEGATQVKWNRHNPSLLASAHGGQVRVWDRRREQPIALITAHLKSIYSLDWSYTKEHYLSTCNVEEQVKLWDMVQPRVCQLVVNAGSVPRALFTPFGDGLVTMATAPGDYSLRLWRLADPERPLAVDTRNTDAVVAFDWRTKRYRYGGVDTEDYQVVSWCKDGHLRFWAISPEHQSACGRRDCPPSALVLTSPTRGRHSVAMSTGTPGGGGNTAMSDDGVDNKLVSTPVDSLSAGSGVVRSVSGSEVLGDAAAVPLTLSQEFSKLQQSQMAGVQFEEMSNRDRTCTARVVVDGKHLVRLKITFPSLYPHNAAPSFDLSSTTLSTAQRGRIKARLAETAANEVEHHRTCLQTCLTTLVALLLEEEVLEEVPCANPASPVARSTDTAEPNGAETRAGVVGARPVSPEPSMAGGAAAAATATGVMPTATATSVFSQSVMLPCPRLAGASFGGAGLLVAFSNFRDPPKLRTYEDLKLFNLDRSARTRLALTPQPSPNKANSANVRKPRIPSFLSFDTYFYDSEFKTPLDFTGWSEADSAVGGDTVATGVGDVDVLPLTVSRETIMLVDTTSLLPVSRALAEKYILDASDIVGTCRHNAAAALSHGRADLYDMWTTLSLVVDPTVYRPTAPLLFAKPHGPPAFDGSQSEVFQPLWAAHPFGRRLTMSMFDHYQRRGDIQTLAMICAVLALPKQLTRTAAVLVRRSRGPRGPRSKLRMVDAAPPPPPHRRTPSHDSTLSASPTATPPPPLSSAVKPAAAPRPKSVLLQPFIREATMATASPERHTYTPRPTGDAYSSMATTGGLFASASSVLSAFRHAGQSKEAPATVMARIEMENRLQPSASDDMVIHTRSRVRPTSPVDTASTVGRVAEDTRAERVRELEEAATLLDHHKVGPSAFYLRRYAELLYIWGLLEKRTEVLKLAGDAAADSLKLVSEEMRRTAPPKGVVFDVVCRICGTMLEGYYCTKCKQYGFDCALCHLAVKGLAHFCMVCGHGGHASHMAEWFASEKVCPVGCGCRCVEQEQVPCVS